MAERLIIYTTSDCDVCDAALTALRARGVDFEERNVLRERRWYEEVLKYAEAVPVLVYPDGTVEYGWQGEIGCTFF